MKLTELNNLPADQLKEQLSLCCGSEKWNKLLSQQFPFQSIPHLVAATENIWYAQCGESDWIEAFSHHPKIGDVKSLNEKFASIQHLASSEQQAVNNAEPGLIELLVESNNLYETKYGFIFIVCATGKSAAEMLRLIVDRMNNTYFEELTIAMGEQHKITLIRLRKLLDDEFNLAPCHITTHVLDTSVGKPGKDITIRLKRPYENGWQTIAQGVTNADGRISDLLAPGRTLLPGNYKMVFNTSQYFSSQNIKGFYPEVEIQFTVFDSSHYHIPLLINPFGFSTYRGS